MILARQQLLPGRFFFSLLRQPQQPVFHHPVVRTIMAVCHRSSTRKRMLHSSLEHLCGNRLFLFRITGTSSPLLLPHLPQKQLRPLQKLVMLKTRTIMTPTRSMVALVRTTRSSPWLWWWWCKLFSVVSIDCDSSSFMSQQQLYQNHQQCSCFHTIPSFPRNVVELSTTTTKIIPLKTTTTMSTTIRTASTIGPETNPEEEKKEIYFRDLARNVSEQTGVSIAKCKTILHSLGDEIKMVRL